MKAILFTHWFEAPDELDKFCKSIGYDNPNYSNNYDLMFDSRVVEFCEQRLSSLWDEKVYKGKDSFDFRIGFAGAGYIREIDTTKKWRLKYNQVDAPIIDYVDINVNDYGYVSVISKEKLSSKVNHKKLSDSATKTLIECMQKYDIDLMDGKTEEIIDKLNHISK